MGCRDHNGSHRHDAGPRTCRRVAPASEMAPAPFAICPKEGSSGALRPGKPTDQRGCLHVLFSFASTQATFLPWTEEGLHRCDSDAVGEPIAAVQPTYRCSSQSRSCARHLTWNGCGLRCLSMLSLSTTSPLVSCPLQYINIL